MSGGAFEESKEMFPSWEELKNFSGQEEWVLEFPEGQVCILGNEERLQGEGAWDFVLGASERSLEGGCDSLVMCFPVWWSKRKVRGSYSQEPRLWEGTIQDSSRDRIARPVWD